MKTHSQPKYHISKRPTISLFMSKNVVFLYCIISLLCIPSVSYGTSTNVGLIQYLASTDSLSKTIPVTVWYPTEVDPISSKFGSYEMLVAQEAEIATGEYGLVVISHGWGGSHLGHQSIAQYLAANGYIVASLLHPNNNYSDNSVESS